MKSVSQVFAEFNLNLTTSNQETAAAKNHRASVKACLRDKFGMTHYFQSGSFGNGTNIPVFSDVDRFAVIPATHIDNNSNKTLRRLRLALVKRFPTTNSIRVKRPSVTLPFGATGLEMTEVIPAKYIGEKCGCRVFENPSPENGVGSLPRRNHTGQYVTEVDTLNDGKVKPLIRFLKVWKYKRSVPIQSIYLELAVAAIVKPLGLTTPGIDVARVLNFLLMQKPPEIKDPFGISGDIPAVASRRKHVNALLTLKNSAAISTNSARAENECDHVRAIKIGSGFIGVNFLTPDLDMKT